jgi:hypothetical protein
LDERVAVARSWFRIADGDGENDGEIESTPTVPIRSGQSPQLEDVIREPPLTTPRVQPKMDVRCTMDENRIDEYRNQGFVIKQANMSKSGKSTKKDEDLNKQTPANKETSNDRKRTANVSQEFVTSIAGFQPLQPNEPKPSGSKQPDSSASGEMVMTAAKTAKRKRSDDQHKEDTGNHPILSGLNQSKHVSSACNMPQ